MSKEVVEFNWDEIFDYDWSLNPEVLTDCTLILSDTERIRAHRGILASSSQFFSDAFTAGLRETHTGEVVIQSNPGNIFRKAVHFMYTGRIEIEVHDAVPLFEVSVIYGIPALKSAVESIVDKNITSAILIEMVRDCYEMNCAESLSWLTPYIVKFFNDYSIQDLTQELDIIVFSDVLKALTMGFNEKKRLVEEFLGDTVPTEEQKRALDAACKSNNGGK
jgi:hypothetical protein